jgi:hypothetical protein
MVGNALSRAARSPNMNNYRRAIMMKNMMGGNAGI